jgi:hypothetical protein
MKPLLQRTRFATLLALALVVALGSVASGNDGDPIILGETVTAESQTKVLYPDITGESAFVVDGSIGAESDTAIEGRSQTGIGVLGESNGSGVKGEARDRGVWGLNRTDAGGLFGPGVRAESVIDDFGEYGVGLQSIGQVQFSQGPAWPSSPSG